METGPELMNSRGESAGGFCGILCVPDTPLPVQVFVDCELFLCPFRVLRPHVNLFQVVVRTGLSLQQGGLYWTNVKRVSVAPAPPVPPDGRGVDRGAVGGRRGLFLVHLSRQRAGQD